MFKSLSQILSSLFTCGVRVVEGSRLEIRDKSTFATLSTNLATLSTFSVSQTEKFRDEGSAWSGFIVGRLGRGAGLRVQNFLLYSGYNASWARGTK